MGKRCKAEAGKELLGGREERTAGREPGKSCRVEAKKEQKTRRGEMNSSRLGGEV